MYQSLAVIITDMLFYHVIIAKETGNIFRMLHNYIVCVNTYFGKQGIFKYFNCLGKLLV